MGHINKMEGREETQSKEVPDSPLMTLKKVGGRGKKYGCPVEAKNHSQIDNQQGNGNLGSPVARN